MGYSNVRLRHVVHSGYAQDNTTVSGTSGGTGGGPFRLSCPSGMAMIGLKARHGAWVDALSPICAIWYVTMRLWVKSTSSRGLVVVATPGGCAAKGAEGPSWD
jgi:hypothetical protein